MNWLITLGIVLFVGAGLVVTAGCYVLWVAHGEPDVNGDPERDAREP